MKKLFLAVFVIAILSLVGVFSYKLVLKKPIPTKKTAQKSQKKSPLLAYRAPIYPKVAKKRSVAAPGKQTYTITQTHHSPNFTQAVIDPEDVKVGQKQTMTVTLGDEKASITEVVAEIETDTGIIKNSLKRISGTDRQGVWEGSWIVKDTHDTTYITTFKAVNKIGEKGEARISWTDPGCSADGGVGHGTALTITASCTVSGVDGADGGLFTINSTSNGTVTIAASAVLSANDFTISAGNLSENSSGSVSIVAGSVICMTDGDADGYPATTTQYADGSACQGGRRRRYLMTAVSTVDCNDAVYSATNNCSGCTTSADCNPPTTGCDLQTYTCSTDYCDRCDNGPETCTANGYTNCDYAPAICTNCCGFRSFYSTHRCWKGLPACALTTPPTC